MLTRVQISNINAINYCDIDFQKGKYKYLDNMIYQEKLVNPIAFYGSNGSGKSSFLEAILHLITLMFGEPQKFSAFVSNNLNIVNHIKSLNEEYGESLNQVIVGNSVEQIKSHIKMFFEIEGTKYEYFIETSLLGCIENEHLIAEETRIFERKRTSYIYNDKQADITESLYPTLRRLAIDNPQDTYVSTAFAFLSNMAFIDAMKRICYSKHSVEKDFRDLIVEKSAAIRKVLTEYKEFPLYDVISKISTDGQKEYFIQLNLGNQDLVMPYTYMSDGMLNQSMLLSVLLSMPENSVLLIDEIEDALHPLTILDFIKVAQSKNIQLIFSSHNTYLLQKLRPDQIIFANWKNGYSTYKKLSDIYPNIREINNIEKMYFSNMFDEEIKNG